MRILIWDFDNTLGYREGAWAGTLLEVLDQHAPEHGERLETIRPFLQSGFPWHQHDTARQVDAETW